MERLLHYVWKYKLYASTPLTENSTTEGFLSLLSIPEQRSSDAGPDFFNAKVKSTARYGRKRGDPRKNFRLVFSSS